MRNLESYRESPDNPGKIEFTDLLEGKCHFDGWNLSIAQSSFFKRLKEQYGIQVNLEEHETANGHIWYSCRGLEMEGSYSPGDLDAIRKDLDSDFSTLEGVYKKHQTFDGRNVIMHSMLSPEIINWIKTSLGIPR